MTFLSKLAFIPLFRFSLPRTPTSQQPGEVLLSRFLLLMPGCRATVREDSWPRGWHTEHMWFPASFGLSSTCQLCHNDFKGILLSHLFPQHRKRAAVMSYILDFISSRHAGTIVSHSFSEGQRNLTPPCAPPKIITIANSFNPHSTPFK